MYEYTYYCTEKGVLESKTKFSFHKQEYQADILSEHSITTKKYSTVT